MKAELSGPLQAFTKRCETVLDDLLPPAEAPPQRLHQAMRYAVLGGGKRIRPLLVYATGTLLGASPESLDRPAAAVELIHAYSLIHDDLPAMDDDDLRRGRPTCHRAYDEATAILAGDALQCLAFELLCSDREDPRMQLDMLAALSVASGTRGMAGGQAMDLGAVGLKLDVDALEAMHRMKTGALIRAAVRLGALAAHAGDTLMKALDDFADALGLAFQIRDDILDVEGTAEALGKTAGKDARADKPTYSSLLGGEEAQRRLAVESARMRDALERCSMADSLLAGIGRFAVGRSS